MKKTILLFFTVFVLFLGLCNVSAKEKSFSTLGNDSEYLAAISYTEKCDALLGDPNKVGTVAYYLQIMLDVIKYAGIVLCIVLTIVDFTKAILGEEKDMYKSLAKKAFARLMYAVVLFFLPTIVKTLLFLIDVYGTCGIA